MSSLGFEAKNATIYQVGVYPAHQICRLSHAWLTRARGGGAVQMIGDIDKDGSGAIEFDEFLDMMTCAAAAVGVWYII